MLDVNFLFELIIAWLLREHLKEFPSIEACLKFALIFIKSYICIFILSQNWIFHKFSYDKTLLLLIVNRV